MKPATTYARFARWSLTRAFALLIVTAAAPGWAADAPPTPLHLMLDWYVNPDHAPLVIAEQRGLFARHGLEVTIDAPGDPSTPGRLAAAGQVDVAIGYQPQLHLEVDQGLPLKRIGTLVATPLNTVMVRADSGIEDLAGLRGRRIGYSVAGVEQALLRTMLEHAGIGIDDVERVNVNFSLAPALLSGQVDAVIGAYRNVEAAQLESQGVEPRSFFVEEHGVPVYDELIFVASPATIAAKGDALRAFISAVEEATLWIDNHPEEAWESFRRYDASLDSEVNQRAFELTLGRFSPSPAALDSGRYLGMQRFLLEQGLIEREQPLEALAVDLNAPAP